MQWRKHCAKRQNLSTTDAKAARVCDEMHWDIVANAFLGVSPKAIVNMPFPLLVLAVAVSSLRKEKSVGMKLLCGGSCSSGVTGADPHWARISSGTGLLIRTGEIVGKDDAQQMQHVGLMLAATDTAETRHRSTQVQELSGEGEGEGKAKGRKGGGGEGEGKEGRGRGRGREGEGEGQGEGQGQQGSRWT
ncbi:MAG: hypothetical protein FRX49_03854 [Trebouxia sp. A1-2]|nr:MAG: hypothetical protein FRX49_03854 [Trebouxia sp. A1-2]